MTEYFDRDLAALEEIEDVLGAYADAHLNPSGPVLARMRAHVLNETVRRNGLAATEQRLAESDVLRGRRLALPRFRVPQRAFALALAATLTLGTGAAVLAAPAGSPFYNARVAIETALLPTQADARLASHEQHLLDRLAEAQAAAARGDPAALAAALVAYRAEVDAAVADVGADADRLAHLEAELARHTAVLQALAATVPEPAAVADAIDASQKAATKLKDRERPAGGRPTDAPAPGGPNTQQGR